MARYHKQMTLNRDQISSRPPTCLPLGLPSCLNIELNELTEEPLFCPDGRTYRV